MPGEGTDDEADSFAAVNSRLEEFIRQLQMFGKLYFLNRVDIENNGRRGEVDLPSHIIERCS
jgi:hypothetical protein